MYIAGLRNVFIMEDITHVLKSLNMNKACLAQNLVEPVHTLLYHDFLSNMSTA